MRKTLGITLMLIISWSAVAQDNSRDTLKIDQITVVAAPSLMIPQFEMPGANTKIDKRLLNSSWSRTGAEALENANGVWLQKTNHGSGAPIIRGLTGNQVLLLLDGVRLNNSIYRYGPNQYLSQINTSWIDHIDIKRGSGSVEYGSDALGGVINIMSRSPFYSDDTQVSLNLGTSLGTHYRFKNFTEISATGNVTLSSPDFYVNAGYTRSNYGDLISGNPEILQTASGYLENAGNFKYAHKINPNNDISIAWFRDIQKEVGRTDKMMDEYDEYFFDPQIMDLGFIRWTTKTGSKYFNTIKATLSYNRLEENRRIREKGSFMQNNESDLVNTLGASVIVLSNPAKFWTASSGIEYYKDRVNSSAYTLALLDSRKRGYRGLYTDNSEMESSSLFTNHYLNWGKLLLNLGARVNHTLIQGLDEEFGDFRLEPTALVASFGVNYEILTGVRISSQISNGFRTPNINDISSFGLFDYGFEVPSPNLKPEKSLSSEIGVKIFSKKISGTISVYQTNLTNLIARIPGTFNGDSIYKGEPVYKKSNTAKAIIRGIETDMNWQVNRKILVSAFASYTFGENMATEEPLRRIPPLFGQLRMSYNISGKFAAGTSVRAASEQNRLSPGDIEDDRIPNGGTPAWICWDIYGSYSISSWALSVHAMNLTNSSYLIHGSGIQQPGRGFLLKLTSKL